MHTQIQERRVRAGEETTLECRLAKNLGQASFRDDASFRAFCGEVIRQHRALEPVPQVPGRLFSFLASRVEAGGDNIIKTPWGGVVVSDYTHPEVNKYLVVRAGQYLAYEKHAQKLETLEMVQGRAAFLLRRRDSKDVELKVIEPGFSVTLQPGDEHCLIALDNSVVFENSKDPLGMDNDLIFVFTPA